MRFDECRTPVVRYLLSYTSSMGPDDSPNALTVLGGMTSDDSWLINALWEQ